MCDQINSWEISPQLPTSRLNEKKFYRFTVDASSTFVTGTAVVVVVLSSFVLLITSSSFAKGIDTSDLVLLFDSKLHNSSLIKKSKIILFYHGRMIKYFCKLWIFKHKFLEIMINIYKNWKKKKRWKKTKGLILDVYFWSKMIYIWL